MECDGHQGDCPAFWLTYIRPETGIASYSWSGPDGVGSDQRCDTCREFGRFRVPGVVQAGFSRPPDG
jgi:hypothetical protein